MLTPFQKFDEAIQSKYTKKTYHKFLNDFIQYCRKSSDEIASMDPKVVESIIFDYIVHQKMRVEKDEISPNSFNVIFSPIQLFLVQNDIVLNWKKLKRMFPRRKPPGNQSPYTEKDILKMVGINVSVRNKAFVHFMASSACRVGAIHTMKVKDVMPVEDGAVVLVYRDDIEEYKTCLTPEAYAALRDYFEYREMMKCPVTGESHLFCDRSNRRGVTYEYSKDLIRGILVQAGLRDAIKGSKERTGKSQNHAFRKRFETILVNADVHQKYVEYMMGHHEKQDKHYFKPTDEELYNNFKKAVSLLTINKTHLMDVQLEKQRIANTELLDEKEKNKTLERRIDEQDAVIQDIQEMLRDMRDEDDSK